MASAQNTQLRDYLKSVLRRIALLRFASGMVAFVAVMSWIVLAVLVWGAIAPQPVLEVVRGVSVGVGVLALIALITFVVWPLVRMPRLSSVADEIENRQDLREMVRAGFEFANDETAARKYSPHLVKEVIRRAVHEIAGLDIGRLFLDRSKLAMVPVAYGGLAVMLLLALVTPVRVSNAFRTILSPHAVAAVDSRANIQAMPGSATVLAGTDVSVVGYDFGLTDEDVSISFSLSEDFWKSEPATPLDRAPGEGDMESALNRYEYTFKDIRHSLDYYFTAGDYRSKTYTLTVVHKPILTDLTVHVTPPDYTGDSPTTEEDSGGNVQALEGSQIRVVAKANNDLDQAWVAYNDGAPGEVKTENRDLSFEFQALKDGSYSVILADAMGFKTEEPLTYSVEVFQDNPPTLDILEPGTDSTMPRTQQIDLSFLASDDYGVREAAIYYRKSGEQRFSREPVALGKQANTREVATTHRWSLDNLTMFPGNYVEYYVQVADNNSVTGPGVTRSKTFTIQMPTMAQLYDKIREEENKRGDMFEQAIQDTEAMRERLEKLSREFTKTEKMEWSQKKDVDKALDTQEAIEEKINEIQQSMEQTLQELSDNEMTSQEIGEKMEQIQELLEQIESDELRDYMEELQKNLEEMKPEDIKEALDNINMSSEEMLEKLERTAKLLEQIQKEQKMEEMVRESQDLMQDQKELADDTADADASDQQEMSELADKQEKLSEKAKELAEKLEKLSKEMEDQKSQQQLQEASESLDKNKEGAQENMEKAAQELQQQQQQGAQQQQQQAMEKLISLFQKTQQAQQAMQQANGQRMAGNLQRFAKETLELSHKQETLAKKLQSTRTEDFSETNELAEKQMQYLKATEKVTDELVNMSSQSLQVPQSLIEELGETLARMQQSVLFLEQNKSFMSTTHATNAVEHLNLATIELLSAAKNCSQGSSSSQSMAQQMLQQMIPQQESIMQQTREMLEMQAMGEKLAQEQQSRMQRLAAQQRTLQEVAERIQKTMQDNKKMLGRMDKTTEDMERVAEQLQQGRLDADLLDREQRILSRLLDASRSVHTKDYEKKREGNVARDIFSSALGGDDQKPESQKLREEIRRAMQLKAPGEFEELIKMYFRALAEESALQGSGESN